MSPLGAPARSSAHEMLGFGITMGLSLALFAIGGNWLDGRLGTSPLFVLLGVALAFGANLVSLMGKLKGRQQADAGPGPDETAPEAGSAKPPGGPDGRDDANR